MKNLDLLSIVHHFGGGVYAKETCITAGLELEQHVHKHDHLSVLVSGSVMLEVDGVKSQIDGFKVLTIAAGKIHKVTSITDVVWLCIHAANETDPDNIDKELIA